MLTVIAAAAAGGVTGLATSAASERLARTAPGGDAVRASRGAHVTLLAVAFAALTAVTGHGWHLPALLLLATITVPLWLIDVRERRLPDAIVLPTYPAVVALLGLQVLLTDASAGQLVRAALAGAAAFAAYLTLAVLYPAGMGFGDVKLAGVLGLYLGFASWSHLAVATAVAFTVGGLWAGAHLLTGSRRGVPFGPALLTGTWVALAVGPWLWDHYLTLTGLA